MIAILLCAGYATRLYPLTRTVPKPLLPVARKPVIDYLVDQIDELPAMSCLHIVTNDKFYRHFCKWAERRPSSGIPIRLYNDGTDCNANRLGAVADLHFVLKRLDAVPPMLVAAGDTIFRFSIKCIWQRFVSENRHIVIALPLTDRKKLQRTGVLKIDKGGRVLRLYEKPGEPCSTWSCPPLYLLQPSALRHLEELVAAGAVPDAPGHFIDYLCRREPVTAQKVSGSRLDIGDADAYRDADQRLRREPLFD